MYIQGAKQTMILSGIELGIFMFNGNMNICQRKKDKNCALNAISSDDLTEYFQKLAVQAVCTINSVLSVKEFLSCKSMFTKNYFGTKICSN